MTPLRKGGRDASVEGAVPLSVALRAGTRAAHEDAESAGFIGDLIAGRLPVAAYTALVAQQLAIYRTLEDLGGGLAADPVAGRVWLPELARTAKLRSDLATLLPGGDPASLLVPATGRYVRHLSTVVPGWPAALLAHHYVRYLGDLAGGQLVRRSVQDHFGTAVEGATSFYAFDAIPRVKVFRDHYRGLLDAAPLDGAEQARVVAEAVVAFGLNRAVFDDLAERFAG